MTPDDENRAFYEPHYATRHPALFLLRGKLSFDQQAKTRRNLALLLPALRELRARDPDRTLRVLDYGSGFGSLLLGLPRGLELYAYDLSEHALAALTRAGALVGRTIRALRIDREGQWREREFDVITCSHVLEHVPSDDALLARFAEALRPGGLLLVNVPINEVWPDPKHVRRYDADALVEKLERHGFLPRSLSQGDRVSGWLLARETRSSAARRVLRPLRAGLALLPLPLLEASEAPLRASPYQQLLVLAQKR